MASLALVGCEPGHLLQSCPSGKFVSNRQLFEGIAQRLIVSPTGPATNGWIKYADVRDVLRRNPDCCKIVLPNPRTASGFTLPFEQSPRILLIYRRYAEGPKPFYMLDVSFGACPTEFEDSGLPISESDLAFYRDKATARRVTWDMR